IRMKILDYVADPRLGRLVRLIAGSLLMAGFMQTQAQAEHASGGGTYFVAPGMRSEFQFNEALVQCKVGHGVMADGSVMQMSMFSSGVDSVTIDRAAKTVNLTGSMLSIVRLRFTDGTSATLSEMVPFVAKGQDNGKRGSGGDSFSLTVVYQDTPG